LRDTTYLLPLPLGGTFSPLPTNDTDMHHEAFSFRYYIWQCPWEIGWLW